MPEAKNDDDMERQGVEEKLFLPGGKFQKEIDKIKSKVNWKIFEDEAAGDRAKAISKLTSGLQLEPVTTKSIKNLEKAMALKEEGNKLFKEGKAQEARDVYTQSLLHYPVNESDPKANKNYAIIYANRSAAQDALKFWPGVVQDIEMALKYGYPRELQFKVYSRNGNALLKLKRYADAKESLKKCLSLIGYSNMPTPMRDQWRKRTQKHINVFGVVKNPKNLERPPHPYLKISGDESKEYKGLSSKITIKDNKVTTTEDIHFEDGLLTEKPFVTVLSDPRSEGKLCPHSLVKMASPTPCSLGSLTLFANEAARDEANTLYHQYEWRLAADFKEKGLSPIARLAFRMIVMMKSDFKMSTTETPPSKEEYLYCGILTEYFEKCLNKIGFKTSSSSKDIFRSVLLALRHHVPIFMIQKPESTTQALEMKSYPKTEFGLGIYPVFNEMIRKSVASDDSDDVLVHFVDDKLVVQSLKNIPKGRNLSFRTENYSTTMNDIVPYKCANPECTLAFPLREKTNEQVLKCPSCGEETNIWKRLKRLHELKREHAVAREIFESGKIREAVEKSAEVIREFETFIYRPYRGITEIEEDLKKYILYEKFQKEEDWLFLQ